MKATQKRFRFSLRLLMIGSVFAGVGLGILGRVALRPDEDYDQLSAPFSGLVETYHPQYGFIGLHYDDNGQLVYTPFPGSLHTDSQPAVPHYPSRLNAVAADSLSSSDR